MKFQITDENEFDKFMEKVVEKHHQEIIKKIEGTFAPKIIRGIRGLAKYLGVSSPTAQMLKDKKVIQCHQNGGLIFFLEDEVIQSIRNLEAKSIN